MGNFLKPQKSGGLPGNQRISAMLCIEEEQVDKFPHPSKIPFGIKDTDEKSLYDIEPCWNEAMDRFLSKKNQSWIEHRALLMHNPNGLFRIYSTNINAQIPQFILQNDTMIWTDNVEM